MWAEWLRAKLTALTEAFLQGAGTGQVLEMQFLCYLEVLVLSERGADAASTVWPLWHAICEASSTDIDRLLSDDPMSMALRISDRQALVTRLLTFQKQFEGPTRRWRQGSPRGIISPGS